MAHLVTEGRFLDFFKKYFLCLFVFESVSEGRAEREGDTESEAGSRL